MEAKLSSTCVLRSLWFAFLFLCYLPYMTCVTIDPKGYILYCPCMGRFGNQADQFLGTLSWAKGMDRTLVLPPWVEYRSGQRQSVQVPFKKYFKISEIAKFHRAMSMEKFMAEVAPMVWPKGQRTVYCYAARKGGDCEAKAGNPFGPFWDTFGVDFDKSEFYGPLSFSGDDPFERDRWTKQFPVSQHHVLAFMGAPGHFPVQPNDRWLHKYLKWSDRITKKVDKFIAENLLEPYIGIHLRNGADWSNACSHIEDDYRSELFSSSQCLGARGEHGRLYHDLCYPPDTVVVSQLASVVQKLAAKSVFVATDDRDLIADFRAKMPDVSFVRLPSDDPHVDLAIVARANYSIVNCVSTFSAFITRERDTFDLRTGFWAFPPSDAKPIEKSTKDEL